MDDRWQCGRCRILFLKARPDSSRDGNICRCPEAGCGIRFGHGIAGNDTRGDFKHSVAPVRMWLEMLS